MGKVTLARAKGIYTLEEVLQVCAAAGEGTEEFPYLEKGIWTQREVADLLKGIGHRVYAGDTGGALCTVGSVEVPNTPSEEEGGETEEPEEPGEREPRRGRRRRG